VFSFCISLIGPQVLGHMEALRVHQLQRAIEKRNPHSQLTSKNIKNLLSAMDVGWGRFSWQRQWHGH